MEDRDLGHTTTGTSCDRAARERTQGHASRKLPGPPHPLSNGFFALRSASRTGTAPNPSAFLGPLTIYARSSPAGRRAASRTPRSSAGGLDQGHVAQLDAPAAGRGRRVGHERKLGPAVDRRGRHAPASLLAQLERGPPALARAGAREARFGYGRNWPKALGPLRGCATTIAAQNRHFSAQQITCAPSTVTRHQEFLNTICG